MELSEEEEEGEEGKRRQAAVGSAANCSTEVCLTSHCAPQLQCVCKGLGLM
jgi:hypothetical protein